MSHIKAHLLPKKPMTQEQYADFLIECKRLWLAVLDEFFDPEYVTRTHNRDATYMAGCRGPACVAAHRAWARNNTGGSPNAYWELYEPILDDFASQAQCYWTEEQERIRSNAHRVLADLRITFAGEVNILGADGTVGSHRRDELAF